MTQDPLNHRGFLKAKFGAGQRKSGRLDVDPKIRNPTNIVINSALHLYKR